MPTESADRLEEQVEAHVTSALDHGVSESEVRSVLRGVIEEQAPPENTVSTTTGPSGSEQADAGTDDEE